MMDVRQTLFRYRSYTPIPFLAVMLVFAEPTGWSMAAGVAVALAGEAARFWGVAYAGALTRVTGNVGAPELITSGPFAFVRNPLYVGNILLYTGVGIMSNAFAPWLVLATALVFIVQYRVIVSLEEEFLLKEFGERFESYRSLVPRFIPRIGRTADVSVASQTPDWKGAVRSETRTIQAIVLVGLLMAARWWWR